MEGVTNTIDELAAEIDTDDPEVLAAHLEGMRALCGWESDGFGRERHEILTRLFDDDDPDGAPEGQTTCEPA
jgi:hypothetical protein